MNKIINSQDKNFEQKFAELLEKRKFESKKIDTTSEKIINDVKKNSDAAVIKYTNKFDNFEIKDFSKLIVSKKEIETAYKTSDKKVIKAIKRACLRIKSYHKKQLPKNQYYKDKDGVYLGTQWKPIGSVGLYVPGGTASYPSSLLMNAIPAIVAGVSRIVIVVPTRNGEINPSILAVAKILDIKEMYKIGGAQAIAALAYGTDSIKSVDKIFGPGNAYVASAKRQVFGSVGIDMIAGPSEILVVADKYNNPRHIAIDLLSQAEHDKLAQSILVTDSQEMANSVQKNILNELKTLPRGEIARISWINFGAIIKVNKMSESVDIINKIAPEHLELAIKDPERYLKKINNAGAIFIGKYTPEAIGDYIAGPNHVLPTDRTAKFSSGLNVLDFMKRSSLVKCDLESLKKIGPDAIILAKEEGLAAHALSISSRIRND